MQAQHICFPDMLAWFQSLFMGARPWVIDLASSSFCLTYVSLFFMGMIIGAFINWAVDHYGWIPKFRSPWQSIPKPVGDILTRKLTDFIPIFGWLSLRRYSQLVFPPFKQFGFKKGTNANQEFEQAIQKLDAMRALSKWTIPGIERPLWWLRPMAVELIVALFVVWLYWWMVDLNMMNPRNFSFHLDQAKNIIIQGKTWMFQEQVILYGIHLFFFTMMFIAALMDLDDYIIPDLINIPGTIAALVLFTLFPFAVYGPLYWFAPMEQGDLFPTTDLASYFKIIAPNNVAVYITPLIAMFLAWSLWCFAILDRVWYTKFGLRRAFALFFRTLRRSPLTPLVLCLWPCGIAFISWVFFTDPNTTPDLANASSIYLDAWESSESVVTFPYVISPRAALFNSMLGMTVGILLIWSVRLVGQWTLGEESMGFGDVMLMGTIGAFVGWQGTLIVFFIAPFAGLAFGIIRAILGMQREIPYGPFLCLGAVIYVTGRNYFWSFFEVLFNDPLLVLILFSVGIVMLGTLLLVWRFIRFLLIQAFRFLAQ